MLVGTACIRPPEVEEPETAPLPRRSRILASNGSVLATLFIENREPIGLSEISPTLRRAVLAIEDARFYAHRGYDAKAVVRAALANQRAGRTVQGGSTITEQYVKNLYFPDGRPRSLRQKVVEAELAWKLEQRRSKDQIFEAYLNTVYLGNGAYGVKAAAEQYFGREASSLTLSEAALLAGLIRSPERDNPRRSPEQALERRNRVIDRMAALRMIGPEESAATRSAPLGLVAPPVGDVVEPHVVEYVKRAVLADPAFGHDETDRARFLFQSGADIRTTIDLGLQRLARRAVDSVLGRPGDPEAALVALDPRTGHVLAMIGGRDFAASQVNLALGADGGGSGRQPGSAFKPFVLAAAFERGIRPNATYSSSPPVIRVSRTEVWRPENAEGRGYGPLNLTDATVHSVNAVFARLGMDVGPARVAGMARRMGITPTLTPHPSVSLGSEEVSPLDMASAYATLANYGVHLGPTPILRAELPRGRQVTPGTLVSRAMDPGTAWLVTDILRGVIERGTGTRAQLDRPAAGKTGTSQTYADAWFVGYTPDLVTAVWVGYPQGRVPMRSVHGIRVFGGTFPAMIWRMFMQDALAGRPPLPLDPPASDMVEIAIDPATGLLAGPYCAGSQIVLVLRQLAPTGTCSPPPAPPAPLPADTPSPSATGGPAPGVSSPSPGAGSASITPAPSPLLSPSPSPSVPAQPAMPSFPVVASPSV